MALKSAKAESVGTIQEVKASDLQLGDVIKCFDGPFGTGIVQQIDGDTVKLFRPYGRHDDFSYTGGVICYISIEHFAIFKSDVLYTVYQRTKLK